MRCFERLQWRHFNNTTWIGVLRKKIGDLHQVPQPVYHLQAEIQQQRCNCAGAFKKHQTPGHGNVEWGGGSHGTAPGIWRTATSRSCLRFVHACVLHTERETATHNRRKNEGSVKAPALHQRGRSSKSGDVKLNNCQVPFSYLYSQTWKYNLHVCVCVHVCTKDIYMCVCVCVCKCVRACTCEGDFFLPPPPFSLSPLSARPFYHHSFVHRRCLRIGDHLVEQTKAKLGSCLFASLMFDEASNIHMAGLLNVFVNILTPELKVYVLIYIYIIYIYYIYVYYIYILYILIYIYILYLCCIYLHCIYIVCV